MIKQNKDPLNDKNQKHGLWISYLNYKIWYKGQYINGSKYGYWIENWLHFDKHQITLHLK